MTDKTKDYFFNSVIPNEYSVLINNTSGEGIIYFNQDCSSDNKIDISKNIVLSFILSKKIPSIHIKSKQNLFFYLKIKNKLPNDEIEEINYGFNFKKNIDSLNPKVYYIKDIYNEGIDINLFLI